jgi:hypothetical protein
MPEIRIGELDNVPDHSPLTSPWAQDVTERVLHHFANLAARNNQWPNPPDGSLCITLDTGTLWHAKGGVWYQRSPYLVCIVTLPTDKGSTSGAGGVVGSGTWTAGPGRRMMRGVIQAKHQRLTVVGLVRSFIGIDGANVGIELQDRIDTLGGPGGQTGSAEGYFNVNAGVRAAEYWLTSASGATGYAMAGSRVFIEDVGPANPLLD